MSGNHSHFISGARRLRAGLALAAVGAGLLAGCASVPPPLERPAGQSEAVRACVEWFGGLDRVTDEAGVRDASAYRIPGFPYLRADRFTASFREPALAGGALAFDVWVERLAALDRTARHYELGNLPAAALSQLGVTDRDAAVKRTTQCRAQLVRDELSVPALREALAQRARVPDDYAQWVRDVGLYAVASGPFATGVEGWHREAEEMFRKAASGEAHAQNLRRYDAAGPRAAPERVREILERAAPDALGVPGLGPGDAETLFDTYAPQYEIETAGEHDRFGPLVWRDAPTPEVDTTRPTVYRRLAYTRFGGRTLLQLVYTAWFPERPADRFLDILAGRLDGVVFRVTLDADGRPLVYDTIHPCGCYHMFFPTAALRPLPAPDPSEEWAFIPATLPRLGPAQRVAVRIASRTHYVVGVRPAEGAPGEPYGFADDDALRALPAAGGRTRSAFGPDALVAGTERTERALFWPMGIASPGTMRQWGRHPTAFLGRRHFDDADLIDRRFARALP